MKFLIAIISILLTFTLAVHADEELFHKAKMAYDDGRYAEAVLLYTSLLDQGISNSEVHYNLANAYFKDSDLPNAVWHYRKAWYNTPRDPDIRANLHFALNAAGAIEPTTSFTEHILLTLSLDEWIMMGVGGYVVLIFLLLTALLVKPARRNVLKLCLFPIIIILIAVAGWLNWQQMRKNPEWVVLQTEATALFGPLEGSTAHFKVPLAALVRQCNTDPKGWIEVEYDGKQGWIKTSYISRLSP